MKIKFDVRNLHGGYWIIYVNNDRGASIAIADVIQSADKFTNKEQWKLIKAIFPALDVAESIAAEPDYDKHSEPKAHTAIGDLYITEVATVGGISVGSDGAYLYRAGKLIDLSQVIEIEA